MAKSGSFSTTQWIADTGGNRYLSFSWEQASQNIEKNTTTISYTLKGNGSYTGWINVRNIKLVINGTTVYSAAGPIKVYKGTVLKTGTMTISHNTNGTKPFSASAECGIYYSAINSKGSGSWDLTAIPKKATISALDGYINEKTKLTVSKPSPNFSYVFWWKCITNTEYRLNVTAISESQYEFTIPDDIYERIPDSPSVKVTVVCETTYNGTSFGFSSCSFTAKVNPEKCKPSVSYSSIEDVSAIANTLTKNTEFIKNISIAKFNGISATPKNEASLKSVTIKNGSLSREALVDGTLSSSLQFTNYVQSGTFTITATDSRGLSNTVTHNATLYDYFAPKISGTATRLGQTGGNFKIDFSGKCFEGSISTGATIQYSVKGEGVDLPFANIAIINKDGTYSNMAQSFTKNGTDFSGSIEINSPGLDYRKEYTITLRIQDCLQAVTSTTVLRRGEPIFDWGENDFNFNVPVHYKGQPISIIEQGTKNVTDPNTNQTVAWGYRKWANGTGECWIRRNVNVKVNTAWGSTGFYYGTISTINFPFKFAEVPTVNVTVEYGDDDKSLFIASSGYSSQNYARPVMLCRNTTETVNCNLNYYVIGRYET